MGKITGNKKRICVALLCSVLLIPAATGCRKDGSSDKQPVQTIDSGIHGIIAIGTDKRENVEQTVQKLFDALERKDASAVREMLSPYAKENISDVDKKIEALLQYYPGADGGYEGNCVESEGNHYGTKDQSIDIHLIVTDKGQKYDLNICLCVRYDEDPSKEGVHLIQMIKEEDKTDAYKWGWEIDEDMPDILVGSYRF